MKHILWFSDPGCREIKNVGGKGANLAIMYKQGFPIPPGFCVTAQAYEHFLKKTGIKKEIFSLLKDLDINDTNRLNEISEKIQELILGAEMPSDIKKEIIEAYDNLNVDIDVFKFANKSAIEMIKAGRSLPFVAVRSSATAEDLPEASFAGAQATYLNIKGNNNVVENVQKCWASLFTARAIYYREKNGFPHDKVLISVVVQRMINADESGVVFTINPSTNTETEIMIEAGFGLGEAVVSGAINPDNYLVDKNNFKIKNKKINEQTWSYIRDESLGRTVKRKLPQAQFEEQVLDDHEIINLAKICKKIEDFYNKPMDIEFAIENKRIYIVQARPVTTFKEKSAEEVLEEKVEPKGEVILEGLAASPGVGTGKVKIVHGIEELSKVQKGDIMVTRMTNPDMVPAMERAVAIVTDEGGISSHASIVSRELGVPCVVGTEKATQTLKDNQEITVDGYHGKVYSGTVEVEHKEVKYSGEKLPTKTKIYMNLGEPEIIEKYKDLPFDGIGLMRLEFLITSYIGKHPLFMIKEGKEHEYVEKLVEGISKVAKAIYPKPIIVRFSDFKTNEYRELEGGEEYEEQEDNPMLGFRGVSRYVSEEFKEAFKLEIRAIKKVREQYDNIHVMLPFVRNVWEVRKVLGLMSNEELIRTENFKIFLMAEVPSVAFIPEEFAKLDIDGVSIGSNDLTSLVLGVDRDNEKLGKMGYFNERNKAVMKAMENILRSFKEHKKLVGICGQSVSNYPEIVKFLVDNGIDSVSVNPDKVVESMVYVNGIENEN
ncbi:MAG: phosphoenolpyruvate synthase [Nanoarchaeota archaeon]|nr:phosphoenolpyruvate synthase [Nanoarchaeota archaeon]